MTPGISSQIITPLGVPALALEEGQKILVAEAWDASPHLETGLEIGIRLAARGHSVDYIHYGALLPYVEFSKRATLSNRKSIMGRRDTPAQAGARLVKHLADRSGLDFSVISPPVEAVEIRHRISPELLETISDLKRATFSGSNQLGLSVASSLSTITRHSEPSPRQHEKLVNDLATSFARAFYIVKNALNTREYNALVVFNGRFACIKGSALAAELSGVQILYHERGSSKEKFSLRPYQPHDRERLQAEILRYWSQANIKTREEKGAKYFENRQRGEDQAWITFNNATKAGLARKIATRARRESRIRKVITFFSSSEDEFISVDDAFKRTEFEWRSQEAAFLQLAYAANRIGYSLIARIHPHLCKKHRSDKLKWNRLAFARNTTGITILPSSFPGDTYELIAESDIVVVYGSTAGIEATYLGKPVILLADSFYDEVDASVYQPRSTTELLSLLEKPDQLSVNRMTALPYGYYMAHYGEPYQLYRPKTLFSGSLLGTDLNRRTKRDFIASKILGFGSAIFSRFPAKTNQIFSRQWKP